MAGAARVPLLLLLLLAGVAPPALVQGFIPIHTFQEQHGEHPSLDGDAWRRSSSVNGAGVGPGDLHPLHHGPKSFHHNFIHRRGKSLLEDAPGEERGLEIHPTWRRRYHGEHHRHAERHHGDVGLVGEHPRHRDDHAGFHEHHRRERLPARIMQEREWREGPPRVGHRRHAGFPHGAKHWGAHRAGRDLGGGEFRHFRDTGRPYQARGPAGIWDSFKSKLAYGASSVAAKIQSAGNQLRNWVSRSRPRVAPTVSFAAEPLWLNAPSSGTCTDPDAKYRDLLFKVLRDMSLPTTAGASCSETLELPTRQLMHTLKRRLKASCSEDLEVGCEQNDCNFIKKHSRMATAMLLSKFHIDPLSVINSTCRPEDISDISRNIDHLSRRVRASMDSLPVESIVENHVNVDEVKPVCEVCLKQNFHKLKETFSEQLLQTCRQAACPKLKDACDFIRDHRVLGRTFLLMTFKPWLKVAQSCANSCLRSPLPVSLMTSTAMSSVEEGAPSWQNLRRQPSQPGTFNWHRVMQLRGFVSSDALELSTLTDSMGNVSSHPRFVIVEFVRPKPVSFRELMAILRLPVDVKLEDEYKQVDNLPVEDTEGNATGASKEASITVNQDLVVGGEALSKQLLPPQADDQFVSGSGDQPNDEPLKETGLLPALEPLKERFSVVFRKWVPSTLLPDGSIALPANNEGQAALSAESSEQAGVTRADM